MDDDAAETDEAKTLEELSEPGSTLMVGTERDGAWEFRPLTVAKVDGSQVQILLDTDEDWARALHDGDVTYVTMSDTRTNTWVSFRGVTSLTQDPALIDELWNPFVAAYFDNGRDTPGIAVLQIDAWDGRYWTTASGRLGSLLSVIRAKVGRAEESGQHGAIAT